MLSDKFESYVIELRREFHKYPELGGYEKKTYERITKEIEAMGLPYERVGDFNIIATLETGRQGKTLMLRADIDALPIMEDQFNLRNKKQVVSLIDGVSHMCGHDAHAAMLLGAMKTLISIKDELCGTILFCFEQGEENFTGIMDMVSALRDRNVDAAWGFHVQSGIPGGYVSVDPGSRMAAAYAFDVKVEGCGGHGSRPDLCIDPIMCTAHILLGIQSIITRELDPNKTVVLHIGKVQAGKVGNVIPDVAEFSGGFRCFDLSQVEQFKESFTRIVTSTAEAHKCKAEIQFGGAYNSIVKPVQNDEELSLIAEASVKKAIGPDKLYHMKPLNGSETFGMYLDICPGVYGLMGIDNDELGSGAQNHNPRFDIDESVLKNGVEVTVQFALDYVKS